MVEGFDISTLVVSGVALAVTFALSFVAKKYSDKYNTVLDLLRYVIESVKDNKLTTEEVDIIYKKVQSLTKTKPGV